jgi:hypothetical protein
VCCSGACASNGSAAGGICATSCVAKGSSCSGTDSACCYPSSCQGLIMPLSGGAGGSGLISPIGTCQ